MCPRTLPRLVLEPAQEFLQSEDVAYPVVIDPSVSIGVGFDAFVQTGVTSDYSADPELRLGTFDGNTVARSILGFTTSAVKGVKVTSAQINLWESWSYSCSARQWDLVGCFCGLDGDAVGQATHVVFKKYSSSTATKGVLVLMRSWLGLH